MRWHAPADARQPAHAAQRAVQAALRAAYAFRRTPRALPNRWSIMRPLRLPLMHAHPQTEKEREIRKANSARWLVSPSVAVLVLWMAIPLAMTIWFSFTHYNLLNPDLRGFAGLDNYRYLASDPSFGPSIVNTLELIVSVLVITVGGGVLMAILFDRKFYGQGVARLLAIAVLRDAHGERADLEEHDPASGLRPRRAGHARGGTAADRLVRRLSAHGGHHDRRVAVAAVRVPDPLYGDPVARPGAEGSGAHRRRGSVLDVFLHHAAPPETGDRSGGHDGDHFPAVD